MLWGILLYSGIAIMVLKLLRTMLTKWGGTIDKSNEINVKGKTIVVTGASSGIGLAAAKEFAKRDANVILACRDMNKAKTVVSQIRKQTSRGQLIVMNLDLASLESVRRFAKEFKEKYDKLDILVNNAGLISPPEKNVKSVEGHEIHFGVNHLGHFLLTNLLLDPLKKASPSRVVTVGSMAHSWGSTDFEGTAKGNARDASISSKVDNALRKLFGISKEYSNSKLANALFSKELGKRLNGTGVRTYALCPGGVYTDIGRDLNVNFVITLLRPLFWYLLKTSEEGAKTILYTALSKNLAHETGEMYRNCAYWDEKSRVKLEEKDAENLWNLSERLVKLRT